MKSRIAVLSALFACLLVAGVSGCKKPLPPSKPLADLTPQEHRGYVVYQTRCAACHYATKTDPLHGPGLQALFKKPYLPSGAAATDERVTDTIVRGRNMMPAFGSQLDDQQLTDLLAYLHTL
ncbi:MAG: c-type cytochrome [Acidobacteriaceae bacterium]